MLLLILDKCGIRGKCHDLIKSYLSGREQCVQIEQLDGEGLLTIFRSPMAKVLYNVPQSSVIGPYVYIVYSKCLKEVVAHLGCNVVLYVNDTQGKNPMKHPMGSDFPWDVMGRLVSHVFMVMGNEFPWEINFNHFLWEVL